MKSTRRAFFKQMLGYAVVSGGLQMFLSACGSSSSYSSSTTSTSTGNCKANGATVSVGANHGHTAPVISAADVTQGTQATYTVAAGTAGHSHTVTVTAAAFTALQGNTAQTITTDADNTGHSHAIAIGCA